MTLLFSYGTLQLESVQIGTFGRRLEGRADAIVGFQEAMMEMKDPEVIALSGKTHHPIAAFSGNPRHRVNGVAFEVTEEELLRADSYETNPAYRRFEARLVSGRKAWVYADARFEPHADFDPDAAGPRGDVLELALGAVSVATMATIAIALLGALLLMLPFVGALFLIAYSVVMSVPLSWGWPVGEFNSGFIVPNAMGYGLLLGLVWLVAVVVSLVIIDRRSTRRN